MAFPPESSIPVSSVCLCDAVNTFEEALYALHEALAHQVWYVEHKTPPNEPAATFFVRYYSDDAALRLYSAGEHLANGIIMMLELSKQELAPFLKKRTRHIGVGLFLLKKRPDHPVTDAVAKLPKSPEWQATLRYRNCWVHEQPPSVDGLGIIYRRRKRWRDSSTGKSKMLGIGGGDEAVSISVSIEAA